MNNKSMVVTNIENEEDRALLYGSEKGYHVIAGIDSIIKIGDKIVYEPYGYNFGWFIKVIE